MRFAKAIWKLLVGVKDALVLLLMLLFFGALYAVLSVRPPAVGEGILALDLDGVVVEQPAKPTVTELMTGTEDRMKQHRLRDLVAALDAGADPQDLAAKLNGPRQPGDEDLVYVWVRRPVIEWALRRAAAAGPGLAGGFVTVFHRYRRARLDGLCRFNGRAQVRQGQIVFTHDRCDALLRFGNLIPAGQFSLLLQFGDLGLVFLVSRHL